MTKINAISLILFTYVYSTSYFVQATAVSLSSPKMIALEETSGVDKALVI